MCCPGGGEGSQVCHPGGEGFVGTSGHVFHRTSLFDPNIEGTLVQVS
ncbi:hypothetical protein GCM10023190_20880 [Enteractinococcus fodinae]